MHSRRQMKARLHIHAPPPGEREASLSLVWPSDPILSWLWGEERSSSLQPVVENATGNGSVAFFFKSTFEEQPLTFTTKSSNMLSAASGLSAWQSTGFFFFFQVIMEIFVDVSAWREPRGAFTSTSLSLHHTPVSLLDSSKRGL